MKKSTILGIVALLALLCPVSLHAEPSSKINYLMEDCVSMLDFGLFLLRQGLSSYPSIAIISDDVEVDVNYDSTSNRIQIWGYRNDPLESVDEAANWSNKFVDAVRAFLLAKSVTGKTPFDHSAMYRFFSHQGFQKPNSPMDLPQELDSITEIKTSQLVSGKKIIYVGCQAPLLGTEIMCSE